MDAGHKQCIYEELISAHALISDVLLNIYTELSNENNEFDFSLIYVHQKLFETTKTLDMAIDELSEE